MLSLSAPETRLVHLLTTDRTSSLCTYTNCFIAQRKVHSLLTPLTAHSVREIHADSDIVYVVFHKMHIVHGGKIKFKVICEFSITTSVNNVLRSVVCTVYLDPPPALIEYWPNSL